MGLNLLRKDLLFHTPLQSKTMETSIFVCLTQKPNSRCASTFIHAQKATKSKRINLVFINFMKPKTKLLISRKVRQASSRLKSLNKKMKLTQLKQKLLSIKFKLPNPKLIILSIKLKLPKPKLKLLSIKMKSTFLKLETLSIQLKFSNLSNKLLLSNKTLQLLGNFKTPILTQKSIT